MIPLTLAEVAAATGGRLAGGADGGTRVTVRHEGFGDAHAACAEHALGWEKVLGWLSLNFEVRP